MPPYLSIIWVLSLLAANGSGLVCEVCTAFMTNSCSGPLKVCSSSQRSCIATLTETALGSLKTVEFEKACGNDWDCSHPASLTAETFRVTTISRCCGQDFCNNGTIDWVPMNETVNGKTCPSCLALDSKPCNNRNTINCTGEEDQCIQFTATKHRGSQITFRGCATKQMSESKGKAAFPGNSVTVTDFGYMSSSGGTLTHQHCCLSVLTMLLLLSFFSASPS